MSATICIELLAEDYPDLFDGLDVESAELEVEADGYQKRAKNSGPPDQCYPAEGEFEIIEASVLGADDMDPDDAIEAVGWETISERWFDEYGGDQGHDPLPEPDPPLPPPGYSR